MKTPLQSVFVGRAAELCLILLVPALAVAGSEDSRLQNLAERAQDRSVWPQLRRLAETASDPERRGQALLVLGYREYDAGLFEPALQDLKSAAETGFSLADQASYYGAEAAQGANQPFQVIEILQDFGTHYPTSTLRLRALELLAKAQLTSGQPEPALRLLVSEPTVRRRPELALLLAQAYTSTNNPPEAARIYQEIYFAFPTSSQASAARDALGGLRTELGSSFPEASEEIQIARADILAARTRWQEARDEYSGLLESRPSSPLVPRWKVGRARCLLHLREADKVIEVLTGSSVAGPEYDPQRLALLVEAYLRKSDAPAALIALDQLRASYATTSSYAAALSALGNYYVRQVDWKVAAVHYQALAQNFPQAEAGQEAHWRLSWSYYLDGDLTRAAQGFVEHLSRYPESDHTAGAIYWLARIAEQRGASSEARSLYAFLRQRYVYNYYGQQAASRLPALDEALAGKGPASQPLASVTEALQKLPPRGDSPLLACGTPPPSEALRPFLTLMNLGLRDLAEQYLLVVVEGSSNGAELKLALSRLHAEEKKPALALFDARRAVPRASEYEFSELPEEIWRRLYPQEFLPLVKRYARTNRLDPALVLALIRQESAFNPRATSVANARGLMQILPETVSPRKRGRARAARRLYEPAYNVQFGTRHLAGLLKELGNSPEQALAAYHAGDFRVKDWLSKHSFQEPAEFLETIPIPATRTYVEALLRDVGIYRALLNRTAKFARCR